MAQVRECLVERYETQDVTFRKVSERGSARVFLECNRRSRLVLPGCMAVRYPEQDHLGCGVCGERFVLSRMVSRRDHAPSEHREVRSPTTSTLDLRQHIKRFLAIVSISLALVVGTSALAFAARDSGKDSSSGDQGKQAAPSSPRQKVGSDDRPGKYDSEELKFLEILNKHRQDKGVPALILSDALTLASERHSEDMGRYDFFAHDTAKSSYFPSGSKPWDRMARSGYDYPNSSRAENLVVGYDTAREAFAAWRASPSHNRNMLDRNQKVIGIARVPVPGSKYGWYWTTDFGSEKDLTSHAPGEPRRPRESRRTGKSKNLA